jgi:DNA (cytosine-5)-methyltransferase 1
MNSFVDTNSQFKTQYALNFGEKIIVDFFAGGGGASTGLEMGLDRCIYVAVNHNPKAISMHEANHPHTIHYVQDVFAVDPIEICNGYDVGWFHASPDCTHHSQAAGGQPRKKEIRDLSWVIPKFAGKKKPDVISLENVKQMLNWGPLIAKRDKATGRVITLEKIEIDGKKQYRVAEPGECVPRDNQFLVPDPKRIGRTWRHFVQDIIDSSTM